MAKEKYLMALDAGSGGGRCFICDTKGHKVVCSFKEWVRAEWNPKIGWKTLCDVTREAIVESKISADKVIGVSSSAMREEIVLLDKDGKEVFFIPKKNVKVKKIAKNFGEDIYLTSGHWPSAAGFALPKLVLLKKLRPEIYQKIDKLLMLNDWIGYKLTGKCASEPSNACETLLFDLAKVDWSKNLISKFGLAENIFPEIRKNGEVLGEVSEEAATQTGLLKGTPVIIGGADTQCGLIGTACIREGCTTAVAGTSTPIQMVLAKPVFDSKWRTWTNCHAVPGLWILESNAGLTGWAYRWVRDALAAVEIAVSKTTGIDSYELLNREVELAPIGANGLVACLGTGIMNARRSRFLKGALLEINPYTKSVLHGKKEIARAVIESTCYAVRGNCEQIEEISGIKINKLRFCGGSAKSKVWAQIQADVLGKPILIPEVIESTSLGAAILAGIGVGVYSNIKEAVESAVHLKIKVEPVKENRKKYNELYKKWLNIYDKLYEFNN